MTPDIFNPTDVQGGDQDGEEGCQGTETAEERVPSAEKPAECEGVPGGAGVRPVRVCGLPGDGGPGPQPGGPPPVLRREVQSEDNTHPGTADTRQTGDSP